jgi:head-tail adaptor
MAVGEFTFRFRFEKRETLDDGYGNTVAGEWVLQFSRFAGLAYRRGGEGVIAGRLEGRQPAILMVRRDPDTRQITNDWRCIDDAEGRVFAIRENPTTTDDRHFLEMLVEAGVAA